jgi:hypothetical protein
MSARTFDIILTNNSGLTLTHSFDHLCHGTWTPNLSPPPSIADGKAARIKSESDGLATGVEGYVKYQVEVTGLDKQGRPLPKDIVYIYWDNPFTLGTTHAKCQCSAEDIPPDCDFDQPAGSGFPAPSLFALHQDFTGAGPGPDAQETVLEIASAVDPIQAGLAPLLFLFGMVGIIDHPFMALTLERVPVPTSLNTCASWRGIDLARGLRPLVRDVPVFSVKALFGLP